MTSPTARTARWLSIALIAAAMVSAAPAHAAGKPKSSGPKVKLEMKYRPGKYLMTTSQDMDQVIQIGAQTQKQKVSSLMVMEMEVDKPDANGTRKARITYKRIRQSMKMGATVQEFDSNDPATAVGPLAAGFKPLIGAQITLILSAENKVTDIAGLDEIFDRQARANPQAAPREYPRPHAEESPVLPRRPPCAVGH